ncbi:histidinol-phosphate transaminase [Xenophilus arseniciresistens]|uniref:Histidinol-phosphate aminotransferase n=1 Tax=Xenophilus arseniciresistens TaxID=1283306 RepID=A0AAE3N5Z9_9BURK|nr:histidinol-phosphate transaminase [Xenophilus arseniciresistens]MDA7415503.1 histidinol-phosphate transaminase [Xenophilus arseniciresistens]
MTAPLDRIRPDVQAMHAYAVQDARGLLKLDAMENPYGLPPALQAALGERLGALALNRYPGARGDDLKAALAAHVQLPEGQALMLGNGSDELIGLLSMACDLPGATVVAPAPGFVMYAMSAQLQGLRYVGVPLTADFELDEAAMLAAIEKEKPAILYLAYPNNPTANLWDREVVRRLVAAQGAQGGLVVMDEAYQPFASHSWLDEIRLDPAAHAHVLLMRTLSKFGLAGVRLGYLIGPAALVAQIDKVRPPYNVSVLNCECALFALEHADVFAQQAAAIRAERDALLARLADLPGVKVWPSDANMVLLRVQGGAQGAHERADAVFEGMKQRGVLVKNVSRMHPLLAQCLRLTVGSAEDNARMLEALRQSL